MTTKTTAVPQEIRSRESCIEELCRMDRNGCFTDADCEAEGMKPLTHLEALACYVTVRFEWPEDLAEVWAFFRELSTFLAFHPDTRFADYVDTETGKEPVFAANQAMRLDEAMERCIVLCDLNDIEVYAIALEVFREQNPHVLGSSLQVVR